ncbi:MAG: LPS export ABC transporter permease LptG [Bdellovibrionales bacterium]|nr:LPS export ABC transporter permease LptG [Bdellovibrionales bacterium]
MLILHRYILVQFLKNTLLALLLFVFLFVVFDFFDRIDRIAEGNADVLSVIQYFALKIPLIASLMLPIAVLVSTLFTVGMMSKNSEITAIRASGITIFWLARPILIASLIFSVISIIANETFVPYATRRVSEIYNIDIRQKDEKGAYSQEHFWWRSGNRFSSTDMFDSRTGSLLNYSEFLLDDEFDVLRRTDARKVDYLSEALGWSMKGVKEFTFDGADSTPLARSRADAPLPIPQTPRDFYNVKTDPHTMSFLELREFINGQRKNGLSVQGYFADLYAKISFPFVIFIVTMTALPFALLPARTGSLAMSFLSGIVIGFSYYAFHSFSLSLGRAELWPPMVAAWSATILMGLVGFILILGAE